MSLPRGCEQTVRHTDTPTVTDTRTDTQTETGGEIQRYQPLADGGVACHCIIAVEDGVLGERSNENKKKRWMQERGCGGKEGGVKSALVIANSGARQVGEAPVHVAELGCALGSRVDGPDACPGGLIGEEAKRNDGGK